MKWTSSNGRKPVYCLMLISEQVALYVVFYFAQFFVFYMLISKNMLKWFLLIICKEHTLSRSTNLLSRNHLTLCFWLRREGRQMVNTEQLLYQTDKSSHRRCSIKKLLTIFTGKHLHWSLLFNLKRDSNTEVFLLRNF